MTDKPTSGKNSNKPQQNNKANNVTKTTEKPANTSTPPSSDANSSVKASTTKAVEPKQEVKNTSTKPAPSKPSTANKEKQIIKKEPKSKISKLAIFALLIALIAIGGVVALYFWHMQQQEALEARLNDSSSKSVLEIQEQMSKVLAMQQETLAVQVEDSVQNMESNTADRITQLNQMVEKFSQNQPTDWLVHEAEYLVRVAARTLWLEKDATAAVGLLLDANDRITELNNPEVLPVRQLIHQDIATIKALPTLEIEEVILSLIALGEQVQGLPLVTLSVPQENADSKNFELSEDVSQWRENILKTWNRFLETFVVVHSRVGDLEPILPADQRENLKENLSLKLQVAQWAASKGKEALFIKSLEDVQSWLLQYYDMEDTKNTSFNETIDGLKDKTISIDVSNKLDSLQAIRNILADREITQPVPVAELFNDVPEEVLEEAEQPETTDASIVDEAIDEVINETTNKATIDEATSEVDVDVENITPVDNAATVVDSIEDTATAAAEETVEKAENSLNKVKDNIETKTDDIKDTIKSVTEGAEKAIEDKTNEIKEGA